LEGKRTKRRGEGWRERHKRDIRTIKFTSYTRKITELHQSQAFLVLEV
jgi:hypothetical protein